MRILLITILVFTISCTSHENEKHYIYYGKNKSDAEYLAALDLRDDLKEVTESEVFVGEETDRFESDGFIYLIGTPTSNENIKKLVEQGKLELSGENPGKRGGILKTVNLESSKKALVIGGSDANGAVYALFDFCTEYLKVDPFSYWNGYKPEKNYDFNPFIVDEKIIEPPLVEYLEYINNDFDELANLKDPPLEIDFENFKELIDAIVRLRFNVLNLNNQLGGHGFVSREHYKKLRPNYKPNDALIDSIANYARKRGMLLHQSFGLGKIPNDFSDQVQLCYEEHKKEWMENWEYQIKNFRFKEDIFVIYGARYPYADRGYESSCGENIVEIANEWFRVKDSLLNVYYPNVPKGNGLYSEAMQDFNDGVRPPKDYYIFWADDGAGGWEVYPKNTDGYKMGIYNHAGFWRNHVVMDPYPVKIDTTMKEMFEKYNATNAVRVNGQTFRLFLLNIEALARVSNFPEKYDGEKFYIEWTTRYFGEKHASEIVQILKDFHYAQYDRMGYVEVLWYIKKSIAYLQDEKVQGAWRSFYVDKEEIKIDNLDWRIKTIRSALERAYQLEGKVDDQAFFFHDHVILQIELLTQLYEFQKSLEHAAMLKERYEMTKSDQDRTAFMDQIKIAKKLLETHTQNRIEGDKNKKWATWYYPSKQRPNNGYPEQEMLDKVLRKEVN
ncbi:MAG: glycosyl hydrolase 115 family protein [Melioribacteraceae bacterium]|nr:glycosyl hydrolase 115 family protein [Melioribacteraceae bacterium]